MNRSDGRVSGIPDDIHNDEVTNVNNSVILIDSDGESEDAANRGTVSGSSSLNTNNASTGGVVCIDLEDEQPSYEDGRVSNPASNGDVHNNNTNNNNNNDNDDGDADGVVIVGERSTRPTVTLHLPGGERLQISARETDQPMYRSFEWQRGVSEARQRLSRRRRRRARELFVHNPNYTRVGNHVHSVPSNDRTYVRTGTVNSNIHQPSDSWNQVPQVSQSEIDRAFEALRRRILVYPPAVRNAFAHAQSVHEFVNMVQATSPAIFRDRAPELVSLFEEYSRFTMVDWANRRVQGMQRPGRTLDRAMVPQHMLPLGGHGGAFSDNLRHTYFHILEGLYTGSYNYTPGEGGGGEEEEEEARTQSIIDMIQRLEETERDKEIKGFMDKTKGLQEEFHEKARSLPYGYSCNFDTTPRVKINITKTGNSETVTVDDSIEDATSGKYLEVPVCTLCGVELGVGIPDSFEGISKEDREVTFEELVEKYGCRCPYQSLMRPSQLDRDLSRRTYIALCGHTFCGRCYTRVNNAREKSRMPKKKLAILKGSAHPDNYGPRLCPAEDCGKVIRAKGRMRRVYF